MSITLAFAGVLQAANQEINPASAETGTPGAVSGPSVVVPVTSFNFGEILDGGEYVHDFTVKNAGTAALEIKKVMPG
jgi:hypothetical protein